MTVNLPDGGRDLTFSERMACIECGVSYPEISPRIFSFNNPHGACPVCDGLGTKLDGSSAGLDSTLRHLNEEFFGASLGSLDRRYKDTQSSRVREEIETYVELQESFGGADLFLELEIHSSLSRRDESSWKMYYPAIMATLVYCSAGGVT